MNFPVMVKNDPSGRNRNSLPCLFEQGKEAVVLFLGSALRNEENNLTRSKLNWSRH